MLHPISTQGVPLPTTSPAARPEAPEAVRAPSGFEAQREERASSNAAADAQASDSPARASIEVALERARIEHPGTLDLSGRVDAIQDLVVQALHDGRELSPSELFLVQVELTKVQFGLELSSKILEHATSGTKTVLQTQA
jgi:hypothetical protein